MGDLSRELYSMLTTQIAHEQINSNVYKNISSFLKFKGLNNIAKFFDDNSKQELEHRDLVISYLDDRNEIITIPTINEIPVHELDITQIAELYLEREQGTTSALKAIMKQSQTESDELTRTFLDKMVFEQIEEESTAQTFLDKIKAFENNAGMIMLFDSGFEGI